MLPHRAPAYQLAATPLGLDMPPHPPGQTACLTAPPPASLQRSPIFALWVDAVWQLTRQFPTAFEFGEDLLLALLDHAHSARFGDFIADSGRAHRALPPTVSVWRWFSDHLSDFVNPRYAPHPGVLAPR